MRIQLSSGTPVEVATPADQPPVCGLVLIPDIMGLRPLFDAHCRRLADQAGFSVACPELWPGRESLSVEERLGLVGALDDAAVLADLVEAAELTGCDRVGVAGFCMGGMYAMKAAGTGRFCASVSFYGMIRVPKMWRSPTQADAIDAVASPGAAPVLALVGGRDAWTPPSEVAELESVGAEVVRYPEADHAFAQDPDRDSYRPEDAADAWERAIGFVRSHAVG